jgi:O-antigen/teichoic acid export membrane protein
MMRVSSEIPLIEGVQAKTPAPVFDARLEDASVRATSAASPSTLPQARRGGVLANSGWALGARLAMAGSRGIGLVVLSRALGTTEFGHYSLLLAAFAVASGIGTFGIDQAHVYLAGGERCRITPLVRNALVLATGLGCMVSALLVGTVHVLHTSIFDGTPQSGVWVTALAIPAVLLHNYIAGVVLGRTRFRYYGCVEIAKWTLHATLLILFAVTGTLSITTALAALYVPIAMSGLLHLFVVTRSEGISAQTLLRGGADLRLARNTLRYAMRAGCISVGQVLHLRLDLYVVKYFSSAAVVGEYALATNLADVLLYAGRAVGLVVFARRARTPRAADETTPRVARGLVFTVLFAALCAFAMRDLLLQLLFGVNSASCSTAVACRLPGIVFESLALTLVGDFLGRGDGGPALRATYAAVVFGLTLNVMLVPGGGIIAAATVFSLASAIRATLLVRRHARSLGLRWYDYALLRNSDLERVRSLTSGVGGAS